MFLLKTMGLAGLLFLSTTAQATFKTTSIPVVFQQEVFTYHAQGDFTAPKVLLLGGGPGFSSWNLELIQSQIAQMGYRVLLADMLGIGENSHIKPLKVLSAWLAQIDSLLRQEMQDDNQVILVGHSWGGLMAMLYAQEHNNKVAKLILVNPVDPEKAAMQHLTEEIQSRNEAFNTGRWDSDQAWSNDIDDSEQSLEYLTLRQIQQVLPTYFMDYDLGTQYAKQFTVKDFDIDLNIQVWKEYDKTPVEFEKLNEFQQPVSFIDCHQDYLMPYNLQAMQKEMQFEKVSLIDQCGHFPWIEQPKIFYTLLKEHLESAPKPESSLPALSAALNRDTVHQKVGESLHD